MTYLIIVLACLWILVGLHEHMHFRRDVPASEDDPIMAEALLAVFLCVAGPLIYVAHYFYSKKKDRKEGDS